MTELGPTITELEPTITELEPTAIERLRALLTERGVEWRGGLPTETMVEADGLDLLYVALPDGRVRAFIRDYLTPEQAIEATLGRGTCRDVRSTDHTIAFECSECGCWVAYDEYWETGIYVPHETGQEHIHPHYCPNCGRKVRA